MVRWTTEQIIALAPDASSAKAGRDLASPRKWLSLGHHADRAAWGECQGSAKDPYQTAIDLSEPAFRCSCPSRKFPCKHALGLFLLLASQPAAFTQQPWPAWVSEWLDKRAARGEKQAQAAEKGKSAPETSAAAQAKRAERREERVDQGLDDLETWLCDVVRQGLKFAQTQPFSFWEAPAARLVDAQAPGLARRVRELASIPGSGEGWETRLVEQVGRLFLLIEGYRHLGDQSPAVQVEIRTAIGWTQGQDELLASAGVRDEWAVLGKRVEEEPLGNLGRSSTMRIQRAWLYGRGSGRYALVLSFAAPGQSLDTSLVPGTVLDAELVYFPGASPLRALVKARFSPPAPVDMISGGSSVAAAWDGYTQAIAANPWLSDFPMALKNVIPVKLGGKWSLQDAEGRLLPIRQNYLPVWSLVSLSGGDPIDLFGEWDGVAIRPVSACAGGRFVFLSPESAEAPQ
jgi:hypothetical protein